MLTWANIGGATGGFLFGFLMTKWDIKWPTIAMLLTGTVAVAAFGIAKDSLWGWRMATFVAGFFTNAAIVGFYASFARGFPAHARATGTGVVLGVGRFGAAGSPILAGLLFAGLGKDHLVTVAVIMAAGSIVAALLLLVLPLRDADRDQIAQAAGGEARAVEDRLISPSSVPRSPGADNGRARPACAARRPAWCRTTHPARAGPRDMSWSAAGGGRCCAPSLPRNRPARAYCS